MNNAVRLSFFLYLSGALPVLAQQYLISTVAGGAPPPTPALAVNASIREPLRVAVHPAGDVYFTSRDYVFKIDRSGVLTQIAADTTLRSTFGVAVDAAGSVFFSEAGHRVWKVSPGGATTLVAGNGASIFAGDGGPASDAQLTAFDLATDAVGNLFIADNNNGRIRKVSPDGVITTVAGTSAILASQDDGPATKTRLGTVVGLGVDPSGNLCVAENDVVSNARIRKVLPDGNISTFAVIPFAPIRGLTVDPSGNIYVSSINFVYKISASGAVSPFAQNEIRGEVFPQGLASDSSGNIYVADQSRNRIRKISPAGVINTIAGDGTVNFSGDGGPALKAQISSPAQIALDGAGAIYFADAFNNRIRKVFPDSTIGTVAGSGLNYAPNDGDGGPATSAVISDPRGVAVDPKGNIYLSDYGRVRKISPSGVINAFAGGLALPLEPHGLIADAVGNVYIADTGNGRIRKVSPDGVMTTVAGGGLASPGDGGLATAASLAFPQGIAIDSAGNLYIAETNGQRVRKVSPAGIITTVVGTGLPFRNGDGRPPLETSISFPADVGVDAAGNLYISDTENRRVLKLSPAGTLTTIAGGGTSIADGLAIAAELVPNEIAVTPSGDIYVSDGRTNSIRLLRPNGPALAVVSVTNAASNLPGSIAPGEIVTLYGAGIGPAVLTQFQIAANGLVSQQLAETRVLFNGIAATMIYASALQTAAIVPYSVTGSTVQVTVEYRGLASAPVTVPLAASSPGIFTFFGQERVGPGALARAGTFVQLYVTGEGQTSPPGIDGKPAAIPLPQPLLPVTVTIDGKDAPVQYAGGAPGFVAGLMQVNVQVPEGVEGFNAAVVVRVGQARSQPGVNMTILGN